MSVKISDLGEKRLIAEFIRPLYNPSNDVEGVGDDCAMLMASNGDVWLLSTDRVPADLISFKLGILDYNGLGQYLARLNISDIAACGGQPIALLLNLGLPNDLDYDDFKALCTGVGLVAEKYECRILGGDITSSSEISISATSIGRAKQGKVLTRRGARKGDAIFISRPLGLSPAAFAYYLRNHDHSLQLIEDDVSLLNMQFTSMDPMVSLGKTLSSNGFCSSCMDNTDGIGQSLLELSNASSVAFIVKKDDVELPGIVAKIANHLGLDPVTLAFSAGADFSLVGTLNESGKAKHTRGPTGCEVKVIGYVDEGNGVYLETADGRQPLEFSGWNYFASN